MITKNIIRASEFNITLRILNAILVYTLPLNLFLQKENIDLGTAVENVVTQLQSVRSKIDEKFNALFTETERIHETIGFYIDKLPRLCGRQTNRSNAKPRASSQITPQTYYRINVFIPFLDTVITQIEKKFITHKNIFRMFHILISSKKIFSSEEEVVALEELIEMYKDDLGSFVEVKAETELWRIQLSKIYITSDTKTIKGTELLKRCNADLYSNIYKLLKIFCCLPISNVYTERSLNSLKRIKTYLKNKMSEQRLNGLAHLKYTGTLQSRRRRYSKNSVEKRED